MNEETGRALPDVLAPGLKAIFCGLNPGALAAATGHHFEGRGNRFWPVLHQAGFTPRLLAPRDDRVLPAFGYGLTTVVARPTASAGELSRPEYLAAAGELERKLAQWRPRCVAFLGKAAYSALSEQTAVDWGAQAATFGGAAVWVLPNPSGLNRGFSLDALVAAYRALRVALEA
ncbi:G/U mismatch-specific DNA glycosylase [Scleromatobacter humisilvae]|uniref:G/U mismatch-specific DNA glycosylase n=1 Tax=Scleromatobacter humisilvae TaxID=2897159 RepID=A0A9X1YJV6_9BURK|nr:G/U mismatch-specific DNA glycosylase [Scleromatobacter humisilvae]MCK9687027.1 G/U mismatch-specific DNA glycosylase [Scleromatobacter humisilvae]